MELVELNDCVGKKINNIVRSVTRRDVFVIVFDDGTFASMRGVEHDFIRTDVGCRQWPEIYSKEEIAEFAIEDYEAEKKYEAQKRERDRNRLEELKRQFGES